MPQFSIAAITGNAAIDVLVGLFFLYFLLSIVCSAVNEGIAAVLGLRAANLERAICNMLDGKENADQFYSHVRIRALFKPGGKLLFPNGRKPSYIPSRVFALSLLDTFVGRGTGKSTDADLVTRAKKAVAGIPSEKVRAMLQDAITDADDDAKKLRAALERDFDEVMDRASGWYKRRVQLILFAIALVLVGVINADSFGIGQRLWKDDALRSAVVAQADRAVQTGQPSCAQSATSAPDKAANCVDEVKALGIPMGWGTDNQPHGFQSTIGKIIGLLVTVFALSLGAPFWFDLLGKVANLRGSGPPAPAAEAKATTTTTTL